MNKKRSFFLSLLFLFLLLLSSVFLNSGNSFALDDVTFNLSSTATTICSDWDSVDNTICGYSYMILTQTNGRGTPITCSATLPNNLHTYTFSSSYSSFAIITPKFSGGFSYSSVTCRSTDTWATLTMTLTNSYVPSSPTGNLDISENGTYDVTSYATATVNVENEVIYGDYHNDLITINNSILTCGAICLVIYFFYCIYRIIIKNSGVK